MPFLRKTVLTVLLVSQAFCELRAQENVSFSLGFGYSHFLGTIGYGADFSSRSSLFLDAAFEVRVVDAFYLGISGEFFSNKFFNGFSSDTYPEGYHAVLIGSYRFRESQETMVKPYVFLGIGVGAIGFEAYSKTSTDRGISASGLACLIVGGGLRDIIAGIGIELKSSIFFPNMEKDERNAAFILEIGLKYSIDWGSTGEKGK